MTLYVYKEKPLIREQADKKIRKKTTQMSPKECMEFAEKMTKLGKSLYELDEEIDVPAIPTLGIEGGTYSVHSFIYQHLLKAFWGWDVDDEDENFEYSRMVNFDWYHPEYAFTYDEEGVKNLVESAGLEPKRIEERFSALTVKARKES